MVRVGGFLKSQNRIRRQRARGRFISPYQVGGTIFGKSTMARYPLMHTSSRLMDPMMTRWIQQRMKGGTIYDTFARMRKCKGDPRKVLWANRAKARKQRKMKGGNLFSQLKKRIHIDFPHRPFPAAHPISDAYRLRKGIKRIRRGRR